MLLTLLQYLRMKLIKYLLATFLIIVTIFIAFKNTTAKTTESINIKSAITSTPSNMSQVLVESNNYIDYSDVNLVNSQNKGLSVLFFAATSLCNTCSDLENEIISRIKEVPANVTILKVDYDNDREMNKKYFVTIQHTIVVLDKDGKEVDRWIGGGFDNMIDNIKPLIAEQNNFQASFKKIIKFLDFFQSKPLKLRCFFI